jgi:Ca2+-binding RTX toxin-like protein
MAPVTSYFVTNYSPDNEYNALYALTSGQQSAVTAALGAWSAVANLTFTLTSDNINNVGDLRFGAYRLMDDKTAAWAYFPSNTPVAGDVWIGPQTNDANPGKGSYDYLTFVHEIGHALGLKHPFDTSATNKTLLTPVLDDVHFTVMSYNDNYSYQPTTPMVLDILAIQSLYGANTQWQAGNTVYSWAADQSVFETIWDGGGIDTIDASNQLAAVRLDLSEGGYSQIGKAFVDLSTNTAVNDGLAIAYGAKIENAIGSNFDDVLLGNALDNVLNGSAGADSMSGGAGNDTYYADNVGDVIIESLNNGIDSVVASVNYALSANVENLTLVGTANINGSGNSLNNTLIGNVGDNILDGGQGVDTMIGGAGNDIYIVDNMSDAVIETSTAAGEIDTVFSTVALTLYTNVENLVLAGVDAINAVGNNLDNRMTGNDQANTLDGGLGADTMIGGGGFDSYYVDNVGDVVIETDASLTAMDRVFSSIDYTLAQNVENLILLGSANLNGTGNSANNRMTGNDGSNILDGGLGADTLIGGLGNDTYIVDNYGDTVTETSTLATEIDTVRSSVAYTLGDNVENLVMTGNEAINGFGNSLNNTMIGNDQANTFDGGLGADTMIGGGGFDSYYVDNYGDVVIETDTSPNAPDRVFSSIGYSLTANVENLILIGNEAINGNGNASDNRMTGNDQANTLDGGLGADTMIGGGGFDSYYVDNVGDVVIETDASLTAIDRVFSSIDYTLVQNVENLILLGSANLNGTGNSANNRMTGNDGSNILDGGLGADTLIGGLGNDTYIVDNYGDTVTETSTLASEIDTVRSSVAYTLGDNVENLVMTGTEAINGFGNSLNNTMIGNDQANTFDGGLGADTMIGGGGFDSYYVDNVGDVVIETDTSPNAPDRVFSSISYSLTANVENLILIGYEAINGTGNASDNRMTGNYLANILDGGLGADTMIGGEGSDSYYVDNVGDVVIETDFYTIDSVFSSIDYTLVQNVDYLTLLGSANLNGTGNALDNHLTGNDGDNILDGGSGSDYMVGGLGNDTYIVDSPGDTVVETSTLGSEIDTVRSVTGYYLGDNVENLALIGVYEINGFGNSLDNTLTGNDSANTLDGGLGADTMIGGGGFDSYYVDNVGDVVIETDASLTALDRVFSSIDYTLVQNVENLILLGSSNLNGTGNSADNRITGNDGNNILNGGLGNDTLLAGQGNDTLIGGLGTDSLTGGSGEDLFVFNDWNESGTGSLRDVINDFNSDQGDKIDLTHFDANLQVAGFNGFTFIGSSNFTGAGQVRFVDQMLSGNVSGNAGADFEIQLVGVHNFTANDLVA